MTIMGDVLRVQGTDDKIPIFEKDFYKYMGKEFVIQQILLLGGLL